MASSYMLSKYLDQRRLIAGLKNNHAIGAL